MKKIILTGPESSGKTTLARQLAHHFECGWVSEYARTYLNDLDRSYSQADLYQIALGQYQLEQEFASLNPPFLICDTSFLVLKIWSLYKYGDCHPFILQQVEQSTQDLYFLCAPDIPWEADPLRENPNNRQELYDIYLKELQRLDLDFMELKGSKERRLYLAEKHITASFLSGK